MPTLPWSTTATALPAHDTEVVVLASRLQLRSFRPTPAFAAAASKVRRQVLASPGALGVSLRAHPLARTYWTLSAWVDDEALQDFVGTEPHRGVMRRFHDDLVAPVFTTWRVPAITLPVPWSTALEHIDAAAG